MIWKVHRKRFQTPCRSCLYDFWFGFYDSKKSTAIFKKTPKMVIFDETRSNSIFIKIWSKSQLETFDTSFENSWCELFQSVITDYKFYPFVICNFHHRILDKILINIEMVDFQENHYFWCFFKNASWLLRIIKSKPEVAQTWSARRLKALAMNFSNHEKICNL